LDSGIGADPAVPRAETVANMPDATGVLNLVDTLKAAAASATLAPGHPLLAGLRVYNIEINLNQFLLEQRTMEYIVKNTGTSWSLSPTQLEASVDAGKLLLKQHPCFQRLLLDLNATPVSSNAAIVRNSCPFEDDVTQ
jgi:hypothetical protein